MFMNYNPVELILKKREGNALNHGELAFFVQSYIDDKIPEYQMSAMLMAIFFQNMTPEEVQTLTEVYIHSGKKIEFPSSMHTVDKHSTGGVGDKISIPLAPIVAACGGKIPMISGRGLGHTGGTLDKLEAIPGFRTDFSEQEFKRMVDEVGFSIISQSKELVPADRRIYALRDVTGTVESLPLITASIMSKKIAEGAQHLVIDLKVGTGAFIKSLSKAEELADLLIATGTKLGQTVKVVFTNMDSLLGHYVGNGLEIKESIEYLQGKRLPDIHEITKKLAIEMLLSAKIFDDYEKAAQKIEQVIDNGEALKYLANFIEAQGGNPNVCYNTSLLPQAALQVPVIAEKDGWIKEINSQGIGYALIDVQAGRRTLESALDYGSGAFLTRKVGFEVKKGEQIGLVYCNDKRIGEQVAKKIIDCYTVTPEKIEKPELIYGTRQ
jgi:pyrimidine-nucleoside phosphorylase